MKRIKKILASLMVVVMVLTAAPLSGFVGLELPDWFNIFASAATYSGTCGDNVKWSYDTSTYTLTISGTGAMYDYNYDNRPWESYEDSIKTVVIGNDVTTIGICAFYDCDSLTSITIPDSVTSIGSSAFSWCDSLTSITIPDSVTSIGDGAFSGCTSLTSITVVDDNTAYSSDEYGVLFNKDKTSLVQYPSGNKRTSYTIPDSVTSIGSSAFYWCYSLTSITIPYSVTSIGSSAFYNCTGLTSITIPDSVTSIGDSAFYWCNSLTIITIPDSVTSIGDSAFLGCDSLTSITIPDSVTSIGVGLFVNCGRLTSITIPDSVTSIGDSAFGNCSNLTSITIPDSVISIGDSVFWGCWNLTSITIPDSVTSIGSSAFEHCNRLTSITIPDSVTSIGDSAFYDCTSLTIITIPDSVTSIGDRAFYWCESLTRITIPDSVTRIGSSAFEDCTSLTDVYYKGTQEQWNSITIGSSNDPLTSATIHFIHTGTCGDNLTWSLDTSTGELVISGTGEMDDYSSSLSVPWYSYRSSIKKLTICDGVTSISSSAFVNCDSLTSITIPDSVTSIGDWAFYYCKSLTSITIPDSVTSIGDSAFYDCRRLTSVTIGNGVTSISSSAFSYCTSLTSITIPDSVTSIGDSVFSGCTSLTSITIPDSVTSIGSSAFYNTGYYNDSFNWEDDVLYIGNHLIEAYTSTSGAYTVKEGTKCIADSAFYECTSLTSITIPDSITSIGSSAFSECTSLTSITIPDSVTSISYCAFYNCTSLTSITIPDSVTSIGYSAFYYCTSLTSVIIGNGVTNIGSRTFYGCTSLTSVTIGNNVTSIGTNAFSSCEKLEEVTFTGDSIVEFGEEIFYGSPKAMLCCEENSWIHFYASSNGMKFCLLDDDKLPAFEIKNNVLVSYRGASENVSVSIVNQIGYGAFEGNSTVENIEIAKSVNVIYNNAFKNCSALKSVYIPQSVTSIGATAFNGCDDVTIWCYAGSYADEYAQIHNIDVEYITLSIDNSIIYLSPNEQTTVTYSLNTHLADNMSVVWESTDKTIVTVDSFGNIKGIKAGTAVVVVASKDGTMRDYCVVKVVGIEALSTLNIDFESGIISGISSNTTSLEGLITMTDSSCNLSYTTLGTDSVVYVERDNEIVDAYTILVYGDVNGDSWYDGQDAIVVDCLANGMLTKDDVSEAVYMAADCNHDGVIDQLDVDLLNQAGTLLANVDQSKSAEVLLETSSEYVEYLDLIDQSFEIEVEDEIETDTDVETTPEQDAKVDIFEMILNFIKSIFEMLLSYIPMPLK